MSGGADVPCTLYRVPCTVYHESNVIPRESYRRRYRPLLLCPLWTEHILKVRRIDFFAVMSIMDRAYSESAENRLCCYVHYGQSIF